MSEPIDAAAIERLIEVYCSAWDEPDAAARDRILLQVWANDATYTDPSVCAVGRAQLSDHIGKVIARYPGSKLVVTSGVDSHHGLVRFTWKKVLADGTSLPEGIDFGEISDDGKIRRIVGFFGPLKPR